MTKTAVILFNLGGPDGPEAVRPFLYNLFRDPAIIGLPDPLRWFIAWMISGRRASYARRIYQTIGGASPLLKGTREQADALQQALGEDFRVFVCMRYWHPRIWETVKEVDSWKADRVVLLPLYPQFSTTTTASSFREWDETAVRTGLSLPTARIRSYPENEGLLAAFAALARPVLSQAHVVGKPRVLFSAHGIPKKRVQDGDPYQQEVGSTAKGIAALLSEDSGFEDWTVCYQSKLGPMEWLEPSIGSEIEKAGREGVPLVVIPVSFVSEHVETLYELDIQYRALAEKSGVPFYGRVSATAVHPLFIAGLADEVKKAIPLREG